MMKQDLKFKYFLLNEDTTYLVGRIGDILNGLQDIQQNTKGMGTKQLVVGSQRIVNQIRRILHTNWGSDNVDILKSLQKSAVAISKAIEEKDDLEEILKNASDEIQDTLADMGIPINSMEKDSRKEDESQNQTSPPKEPKREQPQSQQSPEGQQPMDQSMGQQPTDMNQPLS